MSHHLDTPLAAQNGQLYIDDLYVFSGDHSTGVHHGRQLQRDQSPCEAGLPLHEARYEFKVHWTAPRSKP